MPSIVRRSSLDSSRPMLMFTNSRASSRFSTYSTAASESPSEMTLTIKSADACAAEIQDYTAMYDRLESKRLQEQRYTPSAQKEGDMSKLALVAKVQRALDRRFYAQDAVLRPRLISEKEVAA